LIMHIKIKTIEYIVVKYLLEGRKQNIINNLKINYY
jgi:hypothetical protein